MRRRDTMTTRSPEDLITRLFEAIEEASPDEVRKQLEAGADPSAKQEFLDDPALKAAVESESMEILKLLLEAGAQINAKTSGGETALTEAARTGKVEMVKILLEAGANPNIQDRMEMTPLHWTIHWSRQTAQTPTKPGYIETVQHLLKGGARVDLSHSDGTTPLMMAAKLDEAEICRILMEAGADRKARNKEGQTAADIAMNRGFIALSLSLGGSLPPAGTPLHLFAAVKSGNLKEVESAIASGVDVNSRDGERHTPLMLAAEKGHLDIVRALIKAGADLDAAAEKKGATPLLRALWNNHIEAAKVLLEAGADVHAQDDRALSSAASLGNDDIVRLLLKGGADPNADRGAALRYSSGFGHAEVVKTLLEAGADPNVKDENKETPLITACRGGHEEAVKCLIKGGAALDVKADGTSALIWAAERGHAPIVKVLLEAGAKLAAKGRLIQLIARGDEDAALKALEKEASPDIKDSAAGWTALTWCALLGREEVLKALIAKGAALGSEKPYDSALVGASRLGRTGIVKILLEAGALTKDPKGMLPAIMEAAANGHAETIRLLIAAGADPSCRDRGRTPLMRAAEEGRLEAVRVLIESGADPSAKTALGLTAADEAARMDHDEIVALLKEATQASRQKALEMPHAVPKGSEAQRRDPSLGKELLAGIRAKQRKEVELLLKRGADPDVMDDRGVPAGAMALQLREMQILQVLLDAGASANAIFKIIPFNDETAAAVEMLIKYGADVNVKRANEVTPLMMAVIAGSQDQVKRLLKEGADVNAHDDRQYTALFQACGRAHEEIALTLLDTGARPDIRIGNDSALSLAAIRRLPAVAKRLLTLLYAREDKKAGLFRLIADGDSKAVASSLASGVKADTAEPLTKWPALLWASLLGETGIAEILIAAGADVASARNGWRPLALACASLNRPLCQALMSAGADADIAAGPQGVKLLPYAASCGDTELVRMLIKGGAKVDTATNQSTPLHTAAQKGDIAMMTTLCEAGANLEARDYHKATPLVIALQYNHDDAVKMLLARGAKAEVKLNNRPLLSWLVSTFRTDAAKLMIDHGAPVSAPDAEGRTPLHHAACSCAEDSAALLISSGAKVNAADKKGRTPLMEAARVGSITFLQKLIDAGADPLKKDGEGLFAIDEAAREGEIDAVRLLSGFAGAARLPRVKLWRALADGDAGSVQELLSCAAGDLHGISPLSAAVMMGQIESVRALVELKPDQSEIDRALSEAVLMKDEAIAIVLREAGGHHESPAPSGPSARTIDAVMKEMPSFEFPAILEGKWSRFLQAPDDLISKGALRHQWTTPFAILPCFDDMERSMAHLGLTSLGNLVCERIRDVPMRCYAGAQEPFFAIWNLGVFNQCVDLACYLSDNSYILVTNLEQNIHTAPTLNRSYPGASVAVLGHKLKVWISRFAGRKIMAGKALRKLEEVAAHLDEYLVKRFSPGEGGA